MGLISGEWDGSNRSSAPVASIVSRTPAILWAGRFDRDDFPGRERRHQTLFKVGEETFTVSASLGRKQRPFT